MKHLYLFLIFLFSNSLLFSQNFEQIAALTTTIGNIRDFTSADIDNDGDKDIIAATGGKAAWFKNDSAGVFSSTPFSVSSFLYTNAVKVHDMDGDGDLDFLTANGTHSANSSIAWLPNTDSLGTMGAAVTITNIGNDPRDVDAGDLDGDGDPDIVYAGYGEGRFKWCRNLGNGTSWGAPVTLGTVSATWAKLVKIVDLDNDSDKDIVTLVYATSGFPQIAWFKNDGFGNFTQTTIAGFDGNNAYDFATGDINGDGYLDIVASYYSSDVIYWYKNNGNGTFSGKMLIINFYSGAGSVILNDFDSDGDIDLVAPSVGIQKIKLFRNTGNSTFLPPVTLNTTHNFGTVTFSGTHYMITDDFNNDGKPDFAAINGTTKVNWFKNIPLTPIETSISGTPAISCHDLNDGIIKVSVSGGAPAYTYTWNLPGLSGDSISNLAAGTYIVTVTDAFSSSVVDTFTISNPAAIQLSFTTTLAYPGYGSATVIPSGGVPPFTCEWSNGDTSLVATNLPEGAYVCTITDANGCTQEGSAYVETLPVIEFLAVNLHYVTCFGGSDGGVELLVIETLPPYTFLWNNGDTSRILQNVPVGEYTCTITDNLGGTATISVTFLGPPQISFNYTATQPTNNQANGAISIIDVSGGQGAPYTYLWNTGATSVGIAGITSGIYTCTVTDHKGCTYAETIILDDATSVLNPEWQSQISISPNPARDRCLIEWNDAVPMANIHLYNNLGALVFQDLIRQRNTYSFSTANYPPGIYQIGLISASGKMIFKPLVIGE